VLALVVKPAQKLVAQKDPEGDVRSKLAAAMDKIAELTEEHDAIVSALESATPLKAIRQVLDRHDDVNDPQGATGPEEHAQGDPVLDHDDEIADDAPDPEDDANDNN